MTKVVFSYLTEIPKYLDLKCRQKTGLNVCRFLCESLNSQKLAQMYLTCKELQLLLIILVKDNYRDIIGHSCTLITVLLFLSFEYQ